MRVTSYDEEFDAGVFIASHQDPTELYLNRCLLCRSYLPTKQSLRVTYEQKFLA